MFRVATYNLLGKECARPEWFPCSAPEHLDASRRLPRILAQLETFLDKQTIVLLQEVDDFFVARLHEWIPDGAHLVTRQYGSPEWGALGVAVLIPPIYRLVRCAVESILPPPSEDPRREAIAKNAMIFAELEVRVSGFRFGVATTHCPLVLDRRAYMNWFLAAFVARAQELAGEHLLLVVGGDFNAKTSDSILSYLTTGEASSRVEVEADWPLSIVTPMDNVVGARRTTRIAKPDGSAFDEVLDYILSDRRLTLTDMGLEFLSETSSIPDATHPSDHIPLMAQFHLL